MKNDIYYKIKAVFMRPVNKKITIIEKMIIRTLTIMIICQVLIFSKSSAIVPDTLKLSEYLKLFDNKYTNDFKIGWINQVDNSNVINFTYDKNKELYGRKIKLDKGYVLTPDIYGWAYSYRKINNHLFWLIYYNEHESCTSLMLLVLDTKNNTTSQSYELAKVFGDQGDWCYKYGRFENDSTYNYLKVYGSIEGTTDSISGQDRIRFKGEFLELKKRKLK